MPPSRPAHRFWQNRIRELKATTYSTQNSGYRWWWKINAYSPGVDVLLHEYECTEDGQIWWDDFDRCFYLPKNFTGLWYQRAELDFFIQGWIVYIVSCPLIRIAYCQNTINGEQIFRTSRTLLTHRRKGLRTCDDGIPCSRMVDPTMM